LLPLSLFRSLLLGFNLCLFFLVLNTPTFCCLFRQFSSFLNRLLLLLTFDFCCLFGGFNLCLLFLFLDALPFCCCRCRFFCLSLCLFLFLAIQFCSLLSGFNPLPVRFFLFQPVCLCPIFRLFLSLQSGVILGFGWCGFLRRASEFRNVKRRTFVLRIWCFRREAVFDLFGSDLFLWGGLFRSSLFRGSLFRCLSLRNTNLGHSKHGCLWGLLWCNLDLRGFLLCGWTFRREAVCDRFLFGWSCLFGWHPEVGDSQRRTWFLLLGFVHRVWKLFRWKRLLFRGFGWLWLGRSIA